VGELCLRFYDAEGRPVKGALEGRVIGIELEALRRVPRAVALGGGRRKVAAILGALRGGWVNTLVTDQFTAQRLAKAPLPNTPAAGAGAPNGDRARHGR
jgi:DNA-binding transcriptional regulator LsrR (DeoR family)